MEEDKKYKIIIGFLSVLLVIVILGGFYFFINQNNFNKEDYLENFFSPEINNLTEDQIERKTEEKESGIIGENETREEEAKKEVVQASQSLVEKKDGVLILKLDNGKDHIISDIVTEKKDSSKKNFNVLDDDFTWDDHPLIEPDRFYSFDKLYEEINYYGVYEFYNYGLIFGGKECSNYLLINKANGDSIKVISEKIKISPNKERIISYNKDSSFCEKNGFQVLSKDENDNFFMTIFLGWEAEEARWINNNKVEFKKHNPIRSEDDSVIRISFLPSLKGYYPWEMEEIWNDGLVVEKDDLISLKLNNKKRKDVSKKTYYPDSDKGPCQLFYSKLHEDIGYYGLKEECRIDSEETYYYYYLLVNKNNGYEIKTGSGPGPESISPDKKRIIVDADRDTSPYGSHVVLVETQEGNFKEEGIIYDSDWFLYFPKWISNTEIEFEGTEIASWVCCDGKEEKDYIRYRLEKGSWVKVK